MSLTKLGRYEIVKPLGKGAMGLVYEAQDPNLDRRVAIKTIRVDQLSPELAAEYESRFRAEARAGGRLQHPNIIGVYDSGRDAGLAYMVMELVRGGDLKQQLDHGARLSFDRSFALMRELLSALSFAHELGIIHRDIKPANVMLDSNGRVKLGDFGVARITNSGEATRTQGSMVGTLKYMSPEQVQGLQVDSRTDLFAAGVVLYQLLTGVKPFDGANDFAIMQAIAQQEPPPPSSLNPSLLPSIDAVVARALAKDRELRYPTARDFMLGLRAVAAQAGGAAATMLPAAAPPAAAAATGGEASMAAATGGTNTRLPPVSADPSATSPSSLSQEMELLYWKDIQESSDPVDFQGFLQQFPAGVYASLAARRLRRLARTLNDSTGSQSVLGTSPFETAQATANRPFGAADATPADAATAGDTDEAAAPEPRDETAPAEPAAARAADAPHSPAESAVSEAAGTAPAPPEAPRTEATPADDAQRLAATRAAEEEARWQEALRQEALRKQAAGRSDLAGQAQSGGQTPAPLETAGRERQARPASRDEEDRLAAEAQRAAERRWLGDNAGPESSSFIDLSTPATVPAAPGATTSATTGATTGANPVRKTPARAAVAGVVLVLLAAGAWWAFAGRREVTTSPTVASAPAASPSAASAALTPPTASAPTPAPATAVTPSAAAKTAAALAALNAAPTEATTAPVNASSPSSTSLADAVQNIQSGADPSIRVTARAASSTLVAGRDNLRVSVTSNEAGYVYLFGSAAGDDRLELLQPMRADGRDPIKADTEVVLRLGRKTNMTIPGPWHLWVLVSRQPRDLVTAGWRPRVAGVSRRVGPKEASSTSPWPGPSCAAGVDPCSDSYGAQEVELIVLPPPVAPPADGASAPSTSPLATSPELPKSR